MTKRILRGATLILLLWLAAAVCLDAQTGNGAIQGTVKDPSGAVVPGAKVGMVNTGTNNQSETVANEVGFFVFPSIQRGNYRVSISAPGMETWAGDLLLQVGQTAALEPVLKVGTT